MRTVYLDTNVYCGFAEGTLPENQFELLRRAVAEKRIRISYSMALMEEQVGHCLNKKWGQRAAELARAVCVPKGVRHHRDLVADELQAVLHGHKTPSMFMDGGIENDEFLGFWKSLTADPRALERDMKEFAQEESTRQEQFRLAMKRGKEAAEELKRSSKEHVSMTFPQWFEMHLRPDGWGSALARRALQYAGLPERHWRRMLESRNQTPAFRMLLMVHLAYEYALMVLGTSVKTSFAKDLIHALYASRTHGLVTQDPQFRKIMELIPANQRCEVHDWGSFARTLSIP